MGYLIADQYLAWSQECEERFNQLKANEEELNRIFIDIYGLQDELTPEVEDKDVTVRKADLQREIKSLISYAVGCMFGRYSLDRDGLVYAGGEFSDQWLVVSGQYCLREEVEHAVGEALQRVDCMATSNGACHSDLQTCEDAAQRGTVCVVRPDAESGCVHSIQYCRGTSKKLYEGIRELPVDRKRVECGTANTMYDLCSPEILDAITSGDCSELVRRGWKNAERIDWKTIHYTLTTNHYHPDADNIIPVTDDEYFEDDIVNRFINFIEIAYGKDTLEENLSFIANALKSQNPALPTTNSRSVIRKYFLNDFFEDHVKIYQKRPIYWLFDSGKKNGFKCLIYMHRYQPDTIARIRTDYVHEQQSRYRTAIADLEQQMGGASTRDRVKLNKRLSKLQDQATELRLYEEKIHHLADQMIAIDLDDGVKVNYAKFQDVLAKVK